MEKENLKDKDEECEYDDLVEHKDKELDKDGDDLLGALKGVVSPSLPWMVSHSSVKIVEFEENEVNVKMILGLVLLVIL